GERGAPQGRYREGSNRWMSDPAAGLPAWIQLDWDKPQSVSEVQLIFDTGMHRHLTLSHHDGYTSRMLWGEPQPETVCDYTIEGHDGHQWQPLVSVKGNYQRRRRHRVTPASPIEKLRVTVTKTNGLDHARIMEVRVR